LCSFWNATFTGAFKKGYKRLDERTRSRVEVAIKELLGARASFKIRKGKSEKLKVKNLLFVFEEFLCFCLGCVSWVVCLSFHE